jgi:hypothetical protein
MSISDFDEAGAVLDAPEANRFAANSDVLFGE